MSILIIPSPDTIPVHWIWFQILLTFTFVLHLLFMNLVLGGSLLSIWDIIKGKKLGNETHHFPTLIALTINLGVPPLLFVQVLFGTYFYSSSVMMAVYWILVIPILILAYYGSYIFCNQMKKRPLLSKISLIISTILMLYVGFMFVSNSTMAIQPSRWSDYFTNSSGTILNLSDPSFIPRYLHFIIAAIAIAGLGKAVWSKFLSKDEKEVKTKKIKHGLKTFAWATLFQFIIGTWFWLALPKNVMMSFMGRNIVATLFMIIALISAILIIYFALKGKLINALTQGIFQVIVMSIVREFSRSSYLTEYFHKSELHNVSQTSPFIVFLLVFVIGLLSLYFMYHLTLTPKSTES